MWVFRSAKPFLLSVVALATGLLLAFTLSLALFGSIHIMSFVFCSSVLGLGVD
jgi:predicted exporter